VESPLTVRYPGRAGRDKAGQPFQPFWESPLISDRETTAGTGCAQAFFHGAPGNMTG
jgi:hypothetical protein